jgi:serine/threonine protein phosphatase PrpC
MPYKISAYGISDVGLVRQNNEDFWLQSGDDFFILADGMGGHQAGEIASREAVEGLSRIFQEMLQSSNRSFDDIQDVLYQAIKKTNTITYQMGRSHPELKGMGTTLCCVFIHQNGIIYGHVGDSRIYRLRKRQIERLTEDHSLLRELINLGQLDENRASNFLYKNIITRAIGTESFVEPTIHTGDIKPGDMILMCTDGLTDLLSDKEIEKIMLLSDEEEIGKNLIKAAKQRGGYDNITVVMIKIQEKNDQASLS